MKKAILCMIMALLMVLTTLPMTVSAAEDPDLADAGAATISSLEITDVRIPIAGETPTFSASVPDGAGYEFSPSASGTQYNGVRWSYLTGRTPTYLTADDVFEVGRTYTLRAYIHVSDDSYALSTSGLTATINGKTASVSYSRNIVSSTACIVTCNFTCKELTVIDSIAIEAVAPVAGEHPSYDVTLPEGLKRDTRYDESQGEGFEDWHDGMFWETSSGRMMSAEEKFEASTKYRFYLYLVPEDDSYQIDESLTTATVNGQKVRGGWVSGWGNYYVRGDCFAQTKEDYVIHRVSAPYIGEVIGGQSPVYTATVYNSSALSGYTNVKEGWKNGMRWWKGDTALNPETDKLVTGEEYTVECSVVPKDEDHSFDPDIIDIYGGDGSVGYYSEATKTQNLWVKQKVTPVKPYTTIDRADVTIRPPVAGETPSKTVTLPVGVGYELASNGVRWMDMNFHELDDSAVFESGKQYRLSIYLYRINGDYKFADSSALKGYINGKSANAENVYYNYEVRLGTYFTCADTHSVTVNATSFLEKTDLTNLSLERTGITPFTAALPDNSGTAAFQNVPDGTYTLTVSKKNHVTREYEVTVSGDTSTDVKICPVGDVNMNGKVQSNDAMLAYKHAQGKETDQLTGYAAQCADVNKNGKIQSNDAMSIYKQAQGNHSLW